MCGLAGIVLARPVEASVLECRLRSMAATLRHRGPDAHGVWAETRAGLAHTRLSVLDLSQAGLQPMSDADQRIWLVFNGEIYNFRALRKELEQQGHHFRSRTDSEVILHGYKEWGDEVISRLRGMFALAVWDARAGRLLLARDRLGKKPLYYADTPAGLVFGSEIKAILAWPDVPRVPDLRAIHHYLSLQYVPAPLTAFTGIRSLPPAHTLRLTVSPDGSPGTPTVARYWSLPHPRGAKRPSGPGLHEELIGRFEEAVRLRMVADVPIGALLSGGVDSSAAVAMMAAGGGGRIKTFSVGFEHAEYDETAHARLIAHRYGTDHHELTVTGSDAGRVLPRLAWHYDDPFADSSAVPTFCLAQFARRHVTVALSGDGGDEGFLGYDRYPAMGRQERLSRVPRWLRISAAGVAGAIPGPPRFSRRMAMLTARLSAPAERPQEYYESFIVYFTNRMKRDGYGPALQDLLAESSLDVLRPYFDAAPSFVSGANWADLHTYLPGDLMVKVDRATMAHALECRSPFLDQELIAWAAGLDVETRMPGGAPKGLLKEALAATLPRAVLDRSKMGFGCPLDHWFRGELKEVAHDLLLSATFDRRGLFTRAYVERMLHEHSTGADDHQYRIWSLMMLELWFQTWIDGVPSGPSMDRDQLGDGAPVDRVRRGNAD